MVMPDDMTGARLALWSLKEGGLTTGPGWARAHDICQQHEGERGHDLVHALCHWIEGDLSNRDYWYRRAANWTRADTVEAEWQALDAALI